MITANLTDLTNQKSIRNTVNYKDIGRELTVTPLIGPNGVIQMKIDQLVQKISGDVAIDGNVSSLSILPGYDQFSHFRSLRRNADAANGANFTADVAFLASKRFPIYGSVEN